MNTFVEMKNRLIQIYRDGMFDFLKKADYEDLDDDEELKLLTYMTEEVLTMPTDEQDNFIALLSLYYYITVLSETSNEDEFRELLDPNNEFCDQIIRDMIVKTKDDFIDEVKNQENEMLDDLITFFIDEDTGMYTYMELENGITEFDCWPKVEAVLKDRRHQSIFNKFHPNLLEESKEYKKYYDNEQMLKKMVDLDFNSVGEFLTTFLQARYLFSNSNYFRYFLYQYIFKANEKKSESLPDIMTLILKYYYIDDYLNNPERLNKTAREIAYALEDLEYNSTDNFSGFLNRFLDFDILKYSEAVSFLPTSVIVDINNMINIENRKTYGDDGVWINYDIKNNMDSLIKKNFIRCPEWEDYLVNSNRENLDISIYYSKDKDGKYSIPRVLIASNKDKKIEYLVGRYENGNVEFSMIPIIREKVKGYVNEERINEHMDFLDILSAINKKAENGEELTDSELKILYNLTPDNNRFYQEYSDYIKIIRRKDNAKKSLSRYFKCKEEEIAVSMGEINNNTIVAVDFMAPSSYIEPTNIQVIVGDAECTALQDASCLSKLKFITGSASFPLLTSSKGLENLIFIGKDADFRRLEDPENLNPDLFIGGLSKFKDNKKPKTYENK